MSRVQSKITQHRKESGKYEHFSQKKSTDVNSKVIQTLELLEK